MKKLIIFSLILVSIISVKGQNINHNFDAALAKTFGADEYGMKPYILVILKTGNNNIEDKAIREKLFAGHFENIKRLTDLGKLIVAGPISENENAYRGIFILNVPTFEEAYDLMQNDPTIKEKLLDIELYHWYGSAALAEYLNTHEKIAKYKF